jgi:hypothetical protein
MRLMQRQYLCRASWDAESLHKHLNGNKNG